MPTRLTSWTGRVKIYIINYKSNFKFGMDEYRQHFIFYKCGDMTD